MTTLLAPIAEQNVGPISGVDEDVEPDSQWKEALRSRIEQGLQSMVDKVRQERDTGLRGLREGTREYDNVMKAYQISMDRVRRIAEDQFNQELKIARFERSLALGKEIEGEEFEAFRRQQQAIWDKIKKDGAERPQARQDSTVVGRPTHENGDPLAVPPKANSGEHDAREGPSTPYRESRPPVRVPGATEYRPRDRTQSGGSEQVPGTPGSYGGSRPPRSRGNSSVLAADVEGPPPSGPGPYDHGSIGRQGLSSLSRTRPQDIWLPPQAPKESPVSATSRTFAHATAPNLSPISPNVVNEPHGRSVSRAGSMRSNERPSPLTDMEPGSSLPRDRFGMGSVDERMPARKGKEADRTDYPSYPQPQPQHQREPVPPQPTVYDYYARRPDSRISMPITPARPSMPAQSSDEPYFYQASLVPPARPRQNSEDRSEGMPVRSRSSRHSAASDQGSPENPRYMPQGLASARPIPSKRSFNGEYDPWPVQPPSASRPFYGTQSPPAPPSYAPSNSRPIPRPASTDDHPRRPSPSAPAYGSQSPPDVFPFAGYDVPFTSSSRHRFANSPAGSINGRRNSNGSRSVRSRSSRQEFWGPADLSQRPLQTFEEQSVASDSDSEDYGMDLEDLWHVRERQELTWKLVKEQEANARRKEEEAERVREEARRKEEEARRIREEARLKEEKAARDREEARREAEEAKRKAEEAKRQAEEARRKEEDTKRREKELQMQALEYEKKMEELRAREAELMRREMESRLEEERRKRQEVETKLQEEIRRRQEAEEEARRKEEAEARRREREEAAEMRRRQQEEADRLRRETEEAERRHWERKEREEWERKDRERREKEEQERREREERKWRERREREEQERRDREAREREDRERRAKEEQERQQQEEEQKEREREETRRRKQAAEAEDARRKAKEEADRIEAEAALAAEAEARAQAQEAAMAAEAEALAQARAEAQRHDPMTNNPRPSNPRLSNSRPSDPRSPSEPDLTEELQNPELIRQQAAILEHIQAVNRDAKLRAAEEARRRAEEEAKRVVQEQKRASEEAAKRHAEEAQAKKRYDEEARQRAEIEARMRREQEEEGLRRELEARRRVEEERRRKEELERQREEALLESVLRASAEEEKRKQEERKRQESAGGSFEPPRPSPTYASASSSAPRPVPIPGFAGDRFGSASPSSYSSTSASYYSATSGRSSTARSSTMPTSSTPVPGSTPTSTPSVASTVKGGWKPSSSLPRTATTPIPATPTRSNASSSHRTAFGSTAPQTPSTASHSRSATGGIPHRTEEDFQRFQAEQARIRLERFEQEQIAAQQRRSGGQLTKEQVIELFQEHDRRWASLAERPALFWESFPWPMLRPPLGPEQLTFPEVQAYVLSPHHPADKTPKDRVKDYLRKWHPDRFETKLLPKVPEVNQQRERVKEGAGTVARHLNKILSSLSNSAENGLFG